MDNRVHLEEIRNSFVQMRRVLEWLAEKDLTSINVNANSNIKEALVYANSVETAHLQPLIDKFNG